MRTKFFTEKEIVPKTIIDKDVGLLFLERAVIGKEGTVTATYGRKKHAPTSD